MSPREEELDPFGRPRAGDSLWSGRRGEEAARPPGTEERPAPGGWLPPTDAQADPGTYAPWPGQAPGAATDAAVGVRAAEFAQRAGAAVVDFFVRLAIVLSFTLLGAVAFAGGTSAGEVGVIVGLVVGGVLGGLVYAPYMLARRGGQTIGHRTTNTRVVMADGSPISGGRALLREVAVKGLLFESLGSFLLFVPTILNYVWPLFDQRNEALHDKVCATRVVEA